MASTSLNIFSLFIESVLSMCGIVGNGYIFNMLSLHFGDDFNRIFKSKMLLTFI